MIVNLNLHGYLDLNNFLETCQYGEIYVGFQDGGLLLYPLNTHEISIEFNDEDYLVYGKSFEIPFNEDYPFLSEDITYRDDKYIIEKDDEIYPIIKAMKVYEGVIDEDYDDTIEILTNEDDFRIGHYLINVDMDYLGLDSGYSIKDVRVIKDCFEDDDS